MISTEAATIASKMLDIINHYIEAIHEGSNNYTTQKKTNAKTARDAILVLQTNGDFTPDSYKLILDAWQISDKELQKTAWVREAKTSRTQNSINDCHAILAAYIKATPAPIIFTKSIEDQLFEAVSNPNPETLKILLANGANPNVTNMQGWTPLQMAVFYGNLKAVQVFQTNEKVDWHAKTVSGKDLHELITLGKTNKDLVETGSFDEVEKIVTEKLPKALSAALTSK